MNIEIKISDYDYPLPEERIAKFPLARRDGSRLLVSRAGELSQASFRDMAAMLPPGTLLMFNNTKVIRARMVMHKPGGARVEVFCLEPHEPADYERSLAARGSCVWKCMVGNSKRWKEGALEIAFDLEGARHTLRAYRGERTQQEQTVRFEWDAELTFGQLLELLGRIPIPPYLRRESEDIDNDRYQTVYCKSEGSVAAPTAGLHFSGELMEGLKSAGMATDEVTLHVGAGTFLPVKEEDAALHHMHTEHFEIDRGAIENLIRHAGKVTAVGTTTVRTLESLAGLGYRVMLTGDPEAERTVGQWELYDIPRDIAGVELLGALLAWMSGNGVERLKASTRIMIAPGYRFLVTNMIVTNFHQPKSTLLLLVSAFVGGDRWRGIYDYALGNGFRFLSYGDSNLLIP